MSCTIPFWAVWFAKLGVICISLCNRREGWGWEVMTWLVMQKELPLGLLMPHPNPISNRSYYTPPQRANAHLSVWEEFSASSRSAINMTNMKISERKDGHVPVEIKQEKWEDSSIPYKLCGGSIQYNFPCSQNPWNFVKLSAPTSETR